MHFQINHIRGNSYARLSKVFAAFLTLCFLSACVETVKEINAVDMQAARSFAFSDYQISIDPNVKASDSIQQNIENGFKQAIAEMRPVEGLTAPARDVDLKIEIDGYRMANAALTFLIGDSSQLAGTVKILDSQSGQELGSYYVDKVESGGGLLGLAMNQSETALAKQFAREFFKKLDREFYSKSALQKQEREKEKQAKEMEKEAKRMEEKAKDMENDVGS